MPTITVTVTDDDSGVGTGSITLTVTDSTVKVTGGGFITSGGRTSFGFVAKNAGAGFAGQLEVRAPGKHRFHGDVVSALTGSGNQATWSGTGRWDNVPGFKFEVSVTDNGQGGGKTKTPDTITITIKNASNVVIFSASGPLQGGNIVVH